MHKHDTDLNYTVIGKEFQLTNHLGGLPKTVRQFWFQENPPLAKKLIQVLLQRGKKRSFREATENSHDRDRGPSEPNWEGDGLRDP